MSTVNIFSECFCPSDIHNHFVASPSQRLWQTWFEENPRATRVFLRIYHPNRIDDDDTFIVPIGDPVNTGDQSRAVYLPMWMIDANKYEGLGEEAVIEIINIDDLPKATKIVVRPVDSTLHEVDVINVFENSFSKLGVLQEGKMYLIPLEELGGYQVPVYVSKLEPAAEVYLDGDEVPLEFERAVDYVEPPPRPPTPIPSGPTLLSSPPMSAQPDLMVPSNFLADPPGAQLSEAYSSRPPALGTRNGGNQVHRNASQYPKGFIPFSGTGHRLDGK